LSAGELPADSPTPTIRPGKTIAVVGGGIAGLSAAWELSGSIASGTRVIVFDAASEPGGHLRSADIGGRPVDVGPDAFLARRPEAVELCRELGLSGTLVAPASSTAFIWSRNALRRFPSGLVLGVPTLLGPLARSGIVSTAGVARAALDVVIPTMSTARSQPEGGGKRSDRSVGEIVSRRLGREVADSLTGPLIGGINAGRIDDLSSDAVFPALADANNQRGSLMRALRVAGAGNMPKPPTGTPVQESPVFLAPAAGIASLPTALCVALRERGADIRPDNPVERIEFSGRGQWIVATQNSETSVDGLVLALPARTAAGFIENLDTNLAELLRGIEAASVVVVTLQLDRKALNRPLEGTGFLVPASHGKTITAATFLTTKWPHLAMRDEVLVRASAGRYGDDSPIDASDDDLVRTVTAELEEILGPLGDPRRIVVSRFPESFPQYRVGHLERVAAIETLAAARPAFALAGASYRGIGIPACIGSGRRAARSVARALSPTGATAPSAP
jgi:protoporphyrinogen/coproporphyrinogen III oxidase